MLNIYHSNNMELLKELLLNLMKNDQPKNIFDQEQILVQSSGISQWLKIGIAKDTGIAANIKFPLPATFLWNMFKAILPNVPEQSAFSKEMMKWKIIKILPTVIHTPEFSAIKNYLDNDTSGIKLHQLADKIADLYDQYSVYRPEWISDWEKGEWDKSIVGNHIWQPIMWKLMVELTNSLNHSPYHRANMYEEFILRLKQGKFDKSLLPSRLFVVGISSLPPRFIDALEAISHHTEVHLMFANPSRFYWGDIKDRKQLAKLESKQRKKFLLNKQTNESTSVLKDGATNHFLTLGQDDTLSGAVGNSLLASMGKTGRDYLSLLSERESFELDAFVDIERDSLLHCIQSDILNLEDVTDIVDIETNNHKTIIKDNDNSVQIHTCFSAQREVEALYDYLLTELNNDPDLLPQDIVVMVSDIDKFAPHINSVFGGAPRDRYIPHSVSDRTVASESPILQVFLDLLGIDIGRQEASKIMEILEVPSIMRKYDLSADDLSTLSTWIEQSGIRWGLCPNTATKLGLPEPKRNHWLFGLNRMILGYSIPQDSGEFSETMPFNECQGSSAEIAGKLGLFIDNLINLRSILLEPKSIYEWLETINLLIDDFFDISKDEEEAISIIRNKVSDLFNVVSSTEYDSPIVTDIIHRHFNNIFSKDRLSQHFMMGKVTFCTLMPMRSIPFKHVCLLGMNDGMYPRPNRPIGFDLMAANPILGDRSRRDDDRYLFLEAILAAKEKLYISYVDRNIQDNTTKMPSVIVSELIEYIEKAYCYEADFNKNALTTEHELSKKLKTQHPLAPFSQTLFVGAKKSYSSEWVDSSKASLSKEHNIDTFFSKPLENILFLEAGETKTSKLDITELLRCWSLPVKHFFTRRLKVNFDLIGALSLDEEPFELNAKDAFPIKRQWLESLLEHNNEGKIHKDHFDSVYEKICRKFELEGSLPHGGFAPTNLKEIKETIEDMAALVAKFSKGAPIERMINNTFIIDNHKVELDGWSRQSFEHHNLYYRAGSIRTQDIMQAWVQHLALCASNIQIPTYIIGLKSNQVILPLNEELASNLLRDLVCGYYESMCSPVAFLPRCCHAALNSAKDRNGSILPFDEVNEKVYGAVDVAYNGGFGMSFGEGANPYISRAWPSLDETLVENIYNLSIKYLLPAIGNLSEMDENLMFE